MSAGADARDDRALSGAGALEARTVRAQIEPQDESVEGV